MTNTLDPIAPAKQSRTTFLVGAAFLITTGLGLLLAGGLGELAFVDAIGSTASDDDDWQTSIVLTGLFGASSVASGLWLANRIRRRVLYLIIFSGMVATVTIVLAELVARMGLPAWPASALHGVRPNVQQALMGDAARKDSETRLNAWAARSGTNLAACGRRDANRVHWRFVFGRGERSTAVDRHGEVARSRGRGTRQSGRLGHVTGRIILSRGASRDAAGSQRMRRLCLPGE